MPYIPIDEVESLTDEEAKLLIDEVGVHCARTVGTAGGITLVLEEEGKPTCYLAFGLPLNNGDCFWHTFGDETRSEDPMTFHSSRQALNWYKKVRAWRERAKMPGKVSFAVWMHPDANAQPLDTYVRMAESKRLPGSTRK